MALWFLTSPPALRWQNASRPLFLLNCFAPFGLGTKTGAVYNTNPYTVNGADTTVMSNAILDAILAAGFDGVRMVIDPATLFTAADDARLDVLNALIITGINRRTARGCKVIVDIHPVPGYTAGWSDTDLIDGTAGAEFLRMVYCVKRLAVAIHAQWVADSTKCRPTDVCLELFNEPPRLSDFGGLTAWNTQIKAYYDAVRIDLPQHTIIVAGMDFAAVDGNTSGVSNPTTGLTNITFSNYNVNTAFAIHPYEHFLFTHQNIGFYGDVHGLTWPAASHPGGQAAAESAFTSAGGNVGAFITDTNASYCFERYFDEANAAFLSTKLQTAIDWAVAGGGTAKRIFNTEVGVNFNQANAATTASAAAYLGAQADAARTKNIGCVAIHQQSFDSGFDIMPGGVFVQEIIDALFP